jgi:hypothetical protein
LSVAFCFRSDRIGRSAASILHLVHGNAVANQHARDDQLLVWVALSELFVGRELIRSDYENTAATLVSSGYSIAAIEQILTEDVSPALRSNLGMLGVPEMLGWEPAELKAIIVLQRSRRSLLSWLTRGKPPRLVRERWREVRTILEQLLRDVTDT